MKHKKTEMVSNTKNSSTISQNKKKSNSKHNYLRDISNICDTKGKKDITYYSILIYYLYLFKNIKFKTTNVLFLS